MRGSIQQRGDRWTCRWYDPDGRYRRETHRTKRQAEAALVQHLDETARGIRPLDRHATLNEFIPEWANLTRPSVAPRSWEAYEAHVRLYIAPRLGHHRLADLDARHVDRFVSSLTQDGLSAKYVRGIHGTLSQLLARAAAYGLAKPLPRERYQRVQLPRVEPSQLVVPTIQQVLQIAEAADPRITALIILSGLTGLRQGEALALHPSDIDWLGRRLHVHSQLPKNALQRVEGTKGRRARQVTLPTLVATALSEHVREYPNSTWVFHDTAQPARPLRAFWLTKAWRRALKAAGITGVRYHDLRHTAASLMIASGWSVRRVSEELGHAETSVTTRYLHLWPDQHDQGRNRLDQELATRLGQAKHGTETG